MIKLHLKSNIDLRLADSVTVVFYRDDKELLTKTGSDLNVKQSEVELLLPFSDVALWEAGRYIGINVKAAYSDGSELESNYVYRAFDVTRNKTEYWANTYFGDDEPHHSDVVDTGDATLPDGSKMLAPYTAYARGEKYTGTIQTYDSSFIPVLTGIVVVQPPDKTIYEDGEDIDLTGIIVKPVYPSGKFWEGDSTHPDGVITVSELIIDPTKADIAKYDGRILIGDNIVIKKLKMRAYDHTDYPSDFYHYYDGYAFSPELTDDRGGFDIVGRNNLVVGSRYYVTNYNNHYYFRRVNETEPWGTGSDYYWIESNGYTATTNGFEMTNGWKYLGSSSGAHADNTEIVSTSDGFLGLSNADIESGRFVGQKIDVSWRRPCDRIELKTDFSIRVE